MDGNIPPKDRVRKFYFTHDNEFPSLRHLGVPLRYHVLADVLLRVVFWMPDRLLCVYFENRRYRDRKHETELFFSSVPATHAKFERQEFGQIWLAGDSVVNKVRDELMKAAPSNL